MLHLQIVENLQCSFSGEVVQEIGFQSCESVKWHERSIRSERAKDIRAIVKEYLMHPIYMNEYR